MLAKLGEGNVFSRAPSAQSDLGPHCTALPPIQLHPLSGTNGFMVNKRAVQTLLNAFFLLLKMAYVPLACCGQ